METQSTEQSSARMDDPLFSPIIEALRDILHKTLETIRDVIEFNRGGKPHDCDRHALNVEKNLFNLINLAGALPPIRERDLDLTRPYAVQIPLPNHDPRPYQAFRERRRASERAYELPQNPYDQFEYYTYPQHLIIPSPGPAMPRPPYARH